jgi:hypothetical protein
VRPGLIQFPGSPFAPSRRASSTAAAGLGLGGDFAAGGGG